MDLLRHHRHRHHIIHLLSPLPPPPKPPFLTPNLHPHPHPTSFPIIAVAIIGILATILLLVFYYIFVIKCCLNWHRIDLLRRFSLSGNATGHGRDAALLPHHSPPPHATTGLHESVIRALPIFHFRKPDDSDAECAVCLTDFRRDEKLRRIPNCAHVFHIDCIDVWLQNNPNCPLCRTSVSIPSAIPTHFPSPDFVIELGGDGGGGPNSGEPTSGSPPPTKPEKKARRKHGRGHVSSLGDECIGVGGDEWLSIQPLRRSFSMDSASDRRLYLAVQEIIQGKMANQRDEEVECSSSSGGGGGGSRRLRRGFFSFGHAKSAVIPLHLQP